MPGQDAPNQVFIDRDTERQSNLLSDSGAAPGGITLFGGDDRVPEFLGRTLGAGQGAGLSARRAGGTCAGSGRGEGAVGLRVSERWPNGSAGTAAGTERTKRRPGDPTGGGWERAGGSG